MSDGNGTVQKGLTINNTGASQFRPQTTGFLPRQILASAMSSQQRNATLDDLVETVNTNAKALAELRDRCEITVMQVNKLAVRVDALESALAAFVGRTFWKRLRWLLP